MENRHQVHNLVILDESGSMESIKKFTINGFNELIQTAKSIEIDYPEQEHIISFFTFNARGVKMLHFLDPISKVNEINAETYNPNSNTPLFDAMGFACSKLESVLKSQTNQEYNVLVTILTDGEENASREYNGQSIREMVNRLKEAKWTFTYIGTEHDVEKVADTLSICNVMRFSKTSQSMNYSFNKEKESRAEFSKKIREKKDVTMNYY